MAWPDVVVGVVLLWAALRGWRVGLVAELTGMLALLAAIASAFAYGGQFDERARAITHLGPGSAHVLVLLACAAAAYALVAIAGFALGRVAKLPLVGTANAVLGATFGFAKAAVFIWAALYVALFFPLSNDLRADLHRSLLVVAIERFNAPLDASLRASLPEFVRPYADDVFERHHV